MLVCGQNGTEAFLRIVKYILRKFSVRLRTTLRVRIGIVSCKKRLYTTLTHVLDRRLTSFVIGNDGDKPNERCTITVVDEIYKLVLPIRYVPDTLFSLL